MRRSVLLLAIAIATAFYAAPPADAAPKACLVAPCAEASSRALSSCPAPAAVVCAGGGVLADSLGGIATGGVAAASGAVMRGLTDWVAGGASWLLQRAARLLERSTRPALGSTWFQRQYRTMIELAVGLAVLFLLCAVLQALLRQDARVLLRSAFFALPAAMLLCFAAVTLVEAALAVTDWMTARVLVHFQSDTRAFFDDVGSVLKASGAQSQVPSFLVFLGGLFVALATFVVWLELVMREAAIYVSVAFLPLCLSAMIWEKTAQWCRRLVELLTAIILAKLAIAVAVALAAGAMGHARAGEGGLTALMAGVAVMLIAAMTPWLLLRLVPMAEAAGHLAIHRGSARAAAGSAPGVQTATMIVRQSVLAAARVPGAGRAPRAVAPVPQMPRVSSGGGR